MNIKKILAFILITCIFFTLSINVFAQESEEEVIKVGYIKNYGMIEEPYVRGNEGFGYKYLQKISQYTNHVYEYVEIDLSDGLDMLENGEIDMFGFANYTENREGKYEYTDLPVCYESAYLYGLDDFDIHIENPKDIEGLRIGVIEGDATVDLLEKYLEENDIEVEFVSVKYNDMKSDLEDDLYDLRLATTTYNENDLTPMVYIGKAPIYFISTKENTELIDEIDQAMVSINEDYYLYAENLYIQYYGVIDHITNYITQDDIDAFKYKDVYTVGYNEGHMPLTYTDNEGNPRGIGVDVMNKIAEELDFKIEYVPHDEHSGHDDELDFNLCIVGDSTDINTKVSSPYMMFSMMALKQAGLDDSEVETVAALNYNVLDINTFLYDYPNGEIISDGNIMDSSIKFIENDLDVIVASIEVINIVLESIEINEFELSSLNIDLPATITYSDNLPNDAINAVNKVIEHLDDSFVEASTIENTAAITSENSFLDIWDKYKKKIILGGIIGLGVILILVLLLINGRRLALKKVLEIDQLTKCSTLYKFKIDSRKILDKAKAREYIIVSVDIDNFKNINKMYGYKKGDDILIDLVKRWKSVSPENTLISREASDHFILLIKNMFDNKEEFMKYNEIDSVFQEIDNSNKVKLSRGIFIIENPLDDVENMIDCAHTARLQGKSNYNTSTIFYTDEIHDKQIEKNNIINSMEKAIEENEFFMVLQPKFRLYDKKIIGAEALIRWKIEDGSFVYPNLFIPVFEENGFICKVDYYMFDKVCEFIKQNKEIIPIISVNLSGISMMQEDLVEKLKEIIDKYEIDYNMIEIEITESALVGNMELVYNQINNLRQLGFKISIDDFGIGDSSFARLKDIEIDILKIDRDFLDGNTIGDKSIIILKSILDMARSLNIKTIVEGIETEEQYEKLNGLNCYAGQGYYFAKPMDKEKFLDMLLDK